MTSIFRKHCAIALFALAFPAASLAGPFIQPGDLTLRHDIQLLADYGVITGPTSTWPLAWGPIAADVLRADSSGSFPESVQMALVRVRARAEWEMHTDEYRFRANLSAAEDPTRIRGFQNTPRESAEVGGGFAWIGDRFSVDLNGQAVDSPRDGDDFRADYSSVALAIGNFSISANTLDRWWGPSWDGSLILSSNARPIPSISFDRNFTEPFDWKWLRWIGPWDFAVHYGQFGDERDIPNTRFFAMRFNFKPIPSLEIGLSRTAQWCGNGRPCGFDTFTDLLLGIDNRGGQGVSFSTEPGNQLAGIDFRWTLPLFNRQIAVYSQLIGEDEAGGFPSRNLGQFGIEGSGLWANRWSYRWFGEFSGTSCQFYESSELFNCAYNHGIHTTGYRFEGRSVGHGADNDARVVTAGLILADEANSQWHALVRYGALNRGGPPDVRNTVTTTPEDILSVDVSHRRFFEYGQIEVGIGIEQVDNDTTGQSSDDIRGFIQWRSAY